MKSSYLFGAAMLVASAWFTSLSAQDTTGTASTNTASAAPVTITEPAKETPAAPVEKLAGPTQSTPSKSTYKAPSPDGKIPGDLRGMIEKIDAKEGTLVIDGKTVKLNPKGKVYVNGENKSFEDLKEGDRVAVSFKEGQGGVLNASAIYKGSGHKRKARKEESSEKDTAKPE
jgi:hypothetical protein